MGRSLLATEEGHPGRGAGAQGQGLARNLGGDGRLASLGRVLTAGARAAVPPGGPGKPPDTRRVGGSWSLLDKRSSGSPTLCCALSSLHAPGRFRPAPARITPTCFLWLLGTGLLLLTGLLIPKCHMNVSPAACVLPVPAPQLPAPPRGAFQPRVWRPLTSPGTCSPSGAGTPAFKVSSAVWGWARAQDVDPGAPCSPFWGHATTSIFPLQGSSPSHSSQTQERPHPAFSRCRDPEGLRAGQATSAGKGQGLRGHGGPWCAPQSKAGGRRPNPQLPLVGGLLPQGTCLGFVFMQCFRAKDMPSAWALFPEEKGMQGTETWMQVQGRQAPRASAASP